MLTLVLWGGMPPSAAGAQETPSATSCSPQREFSALWETFNQSYGLFNAKNVDWHAMRRVFEPQALAVRNCEELFDVLASMLAQLNDHHVFLYKRDRLFKSGDVPRADTGTFSLPLVRSRYLQEATAPWQGHVTAGWLRDSVAYLHLRDFDDADTLAHVMDQELRRFGAAKAVVIDLRNNTGGSDFAVQMMASRFADRRRFYQISRIRIGPGANDFEAPRSWTIRPRGTAWRGRVVILTNRHTMSAAEVFITALRDRPNVVVVGERTAGVFADIFTDTLPNGWQFAVPYTDHRTCFGRSLEGVGHAPDIRLRNEVEDVTQGRDRIIEMGIRVSLGPTAVAVRQACPANLPLSIPERLRIAAADGERAFRAAEIRLPTSRLANDGTPGEYDVAADEMLSAAQPRLALRTLLIGATRLPTSWRMHLIIGDEYRRRGMERDARTHFARALSLVSTNSPYQRRWHGRLIERLR